MLRRINALINDIRRSTFEGIGKPEPLKNNLSGWGVLMGPIGLFTMSKTELSALSPAGAITIDLRARRHDIYQKYAAGHRDTI